MVTEIDWDVLRDKARSMIGRAYAPYSRYPVGAAGITAEGGVVAGCNVENVSYGLGICAEVALVAALVNDGGGALRAVSVCDARGAVLMPCGRCRQVLLEHGGRELLVDHPGGPRMLAELLPDAFGPDDLEAVRS
ncbi:cytidine deaminase [Gordonia sp. JH63]|uniref:Cytidine deaminase n=1 Tax=Gordonia hongkongensis TaxID=1701090 RepID=A0AAX3TAV2_9ACTN|nr:MULTISPECIES: cytidine deaminase [Gordonia]MCZ4535424.1 cytidine deaminase [Gordonia terrae]OCW85305.1 cytidine deaminase [Nocardia farcinica]MBN0971350.1 cytidine deaminase [Gordonia sp. BP-119]MBN0982277.1 cytidine deaminase [Gordonia sp. BP-94]MBR7190711.1 cytidine deaminase [Gordonia sp. SCSIO 19800]